MTPLNNELLDGIPVFTENWVAMIPKTHPLAKVRRKTVDIQELAGNDLIISSRRSRHEEITGWFEKQGQKPRIKIQIAHSSNAVNLVERGIGIAIFPASVAKNISSESNVVIKKITPEVSVTYLLSWDRKRTPGVLASRFIEHVKALQ
jgi:DNA-binding transcriptional LysR family regulator